MFKVRNRVVLPTRMEYDEAYLLTTVAYMEKE